MTTESAAAFPEGAPDPTAPVTQALKRRDELAEKQQRKRLNFTLWAAALSPVAVILLVSQIIGQPSDSVSLLLIALEMLALFAALVIGFIPIGHSHKEWIGHRVRAEVLRREQFLCRMRLGPYLGADEADLQTRIDQRLATIDNDVIDPIELLRTSGAEDWGFPVDAPSPIASPADASLAQSVQRYLTDRVIDQRVWFTRESARHHRRAKIWDGAAKLVLLLALVAATYHLGRLSAAADKGETGGRQAVSENKTLDFIAIVLPTLGAAAVGLQSILGSERLSKSYAFYAQALLRLEESLRNIAAELNRPNLSAARKNELARSFCVVVARCEELLSAELRQWWLTMHPEVPRAGA